MTEGQLVMGRDHKMLCAIVGIEPSYEFYWVQELLTGDLWGVSRKYLHEEFSLFPISVSTIPNGADYL